MNMNHFFSKALAGAFLIITSSLTFTGTAQAKVYDLVFGTSVNHLEVPVSQSRIMVFDAPIENVSVGNPEVADIDPFR